MGSNPINPDDVMRKVREDLVSGRLRDKLRSRGVPTYSASKESPGYIERRHMDGRIEVGRMVDGEFVLKDPDAHE